MASAHQEALKLDICRRFYIENKSKIQISKDLKCSPTTVKKYIRDNPPESDLVKALVNPVPVASPSETKGYLFKTLQLSIHNAVEAGDPNLKHLGLLDMALEHVKYLGLSSATDMLRLELAFENYIQYRVFTKRVTEMNGQMFEVDWMKRTEKMVKLVSKYAEAAQKHLKMFQDLIRELEIKYNKRSPDFGRIQNLNIQRNEINVTSAVCETSQDQSLRA